MVQVFISRFTPGLENGKDVRFRKGDKVMYGKRNPVEITIDSDRMKHKDAPGNGMGYEAIFGDTGERSFASELGIFDWEGKKA